MLRRQIFPPDSMSFLAGNSEMARRIREYDWADHQFGAPDSWPQSLRSALGICLHSLFPTAIYWGPDLRLLYNDAWAPIPGPRHPEALGAPAHEVWSDIWHVIEPQFLHLIETGSGVFVENQLLPMRRYGIAEETYWSYSFTAIRGDDGTIAGVFNSGLETTNHVLSQRQMRFLLKLSDVFRNQTNFELARRFAIKMLGEHLSAHRVEFSERSKKSGEKLHITEEWTARDTTDDLTCGRKPDNMDTPVMVPWTEDGKFLASLTLYSRKPYQWNEFELTTAEKVLERIMISAERMRVAEREKIMVREINHRARNSLAVVQSVVRQTPAEDLVSFRKKIEGRIAALARSHDLLSEEDWGPVEFRTLLNRELAPYVEDKSVSVSLDGPSVRVTPPQAQLLALLLHELRTNAAKYGALKAPGGSLNVFWSTKQDSLNLRWTEHSVSVPAKPGPDGFGSTLLKRVIQNQFNGSFSRNFDQRGMRCEIKIPLGWHETAARDVV